MIVTCPACSSKFRVRNEDLGTEGVELKCQNCGQRFLAMPPEQSATPDLSSRLAALRKTHDEAIARAGDLEKVVSALRAELGEAKTALAQSNHALNEANQNNSDVGQLNSALLRSQRSAQALAGERDLLKAEVEKLTVRMTHMQSVPAPIQSAPSAISNAEVDRLRAEIAQLQSGAISDSLRNALASVRPLSWGLDQAIDYIEPFSTNQPQLAGHLKQLRLLRTLLKRFEELLPNI